MAVLSICMFTVVKIHIWKVGATKTREHTGVPDMQQMVIQVHMLSLYALNRGGYGKGNIVIFLS